MIVLATTSHDYNEMSLFTPFQVDFNDIRARNIAERRREEEQKRKEEQQRKERIDSVVKELTGVYSASKFLKNDVMNVVQMLSDDVVTFKNDITAFILCKQIPTNEYSLK